MPSTVARIAAEPSATAVTSPVPDTVAMAVFALLHATTRPVNTFPAASRATAVACVVCPTSSVAAARFTLTDATGTGTTVIALEPTTPSTVASMRVVPGVTPRTRPALETIATALLLEVHCTVRPTMACPAALRSSAVRSRFSPTITDATPGVTTIDVGASVVTVIVADVMRPSADAKISAVPALMAVTVPSGATEATLGAPDVHVTGRCASTLPPASSAAAAKRVVPPTMTVTALGVMRSEAIGDAVTVTVAVPTLPSLLTVIVAVPGAAAVTSPVAVT